jgi:predicted DNA-binding protein with PD1-like motif
MSLTRPPEEARTAAAGEGTPVNSALIVEEGAMGRVAYARVAPNEDLVHAIEKFCLSAGFKNAFVRGALGSLVDACLVDAHGNQRRVHGPAVEIVSLAGEVRLLDDGSLNAALTGVVADTAGSVYGGLFVAGSNTVCMTLEVTLEEWLPTSATSG